MFSYSVGLFLMSVMSLNVETKIFSLPLNVIPCLILSRGSTDRRASCFPYVLIPWKMLAPSLWFLGIKQCYKSFPFVVVSFQVSTEFFIVSRQPNFVKGVFVLSTLMNFSLLKKQKNRMNITVRNTLGRKPIRFGSPTICIYRHRKQQI